MPPSQIQVNYFRFMVAQRQRRSGAEQSGAEPEERREAAGWLLIPPVNHQSAGTPSTDTPGSSELMKPREGGSRQCPQLAAASFSASSPASSETGSQRFALLSLMSGQTSTLKPMWDN